MPLSQVGGGTPFKGSKGQNIAKGIQAYLQAQAQNPFTLSPGQQRFSGAGTPIANVPATPKRHGPLQVAGIGDGTGLPSGSVYQVGPQGKVTVVANEDKTKIAITQAKEFRADKRIANLQIVERSERGMEAALKMSTSPNVKSRIASDQTLGVLFQKMLDPTSVVRESEYARTPEGAALVNRMLGAAEQIVKGGLRLKDEDREALVEMAQKLLYEAKITANKAFDEFGTRADEIGLNKRIIFGGAKRFDIGGIIPQQFSPEEIDAELRRRGAIQ